MKRLVVAGGLFAAAVTASGCMTVADWISDEDLSAPRRGRVFADRECGRCHQVGRAGESPYPGAPTFSSIRMRYTGPALERELQAIEDVGHFRMPALSTVPADRRDLIAYIESLTPLQPDAVGDVTLPTPGYR